MIQSRIVKQLLSQLWLTFYMTALYTCKSWTSPILPSNNKHAVDALKKLISSTKY